MGVSNAVSVEVHKRAESSPNDFLYGGKLADVHLLCDAPSLRHRRALLRSEDPSMRRRPVKIQVRKWTSQGTPVRALSSKMHRICILILSVTATAIAIMAGLSLSSTPYSGPTVEHSVTRGESVWSIAESLNSARPIDEVVYDIESLNSIDNGLFTGQSIVVPLN